MEASGGHGRPKKAWKEAITGDLGTNGLSIYLADDKRGVEKATAICYWTSPPDFKCMVMMMIMSSSQHFTFSPGV